MEKFPKIGSEIITKPAAGFAAFFEVPRAVFIRGAALLIAAHTRQRRLTAAAIPPLPNSINTDRIHLTATTSLPSTKSTSLGAPH